MFCSCFFCRYHGTVRIATIVLFQKMAAKKLLLLSEHHNLEQANLKTTNKIQKQHEFFQQTHQ